jgi:TonB family protein
MNNILRFSTSLALGTMLATTAGAAFESIKINPDSPLPEFPLSLKVDGITKGKAIIAVSINNEGRAVDFLVLGYTHELFAKSCIEVLKEWQFTPAKLDGTPVSVKTELTFDFALEGAVVTTNIMNHMLFDGFEGVGDNRLIRRQCGAGELDRPPSLVNGSAPQYAVAAEKEGVRGRVEVHFYIDEKGAVLMPVVEPDAHPYLAQEAVTAVRNWRFEPATRHGRPVLVAASQVFDFSSTK